MKRTFLILIALAIGLSGFAQEPWTLEKCIEHAQQNNLTVKSMELQADYTENTYKQSREDLFPSLSGSTGYSYQKGRYENQFTGGIETTNTNSLNFYLGANVVLFNGLQNINTIKKNKTDLMADESAVEKVKRNISLEVGLAFLLILRNEELLNTAQKQLETTQGQVARTQKLVTAGSLPEGDLLEVQAQAAQEEASVIEAENQLAIAKLNLSQLLELQTPEGFEIVKPEIKSLDSESISFSISDVFAEVGKLPEMQEAGYRLQSAERSLSIAKGAYSPTLSASLGQSTGYSDLRRDFKGNKISFSDQFDENQNTNFGVSLQIPIYAKGRIRQQVSNAKIGILNAQNNIEQVKRTVYKSIQQAYIDAKAALATYKSSKKSVEASEKAFEYTEKKFNVGALNAMDFNMAKTNLFRARATLAQSKYDYVFRLKVLDFYRGVPITL